MTRGLLDTLDREELQGVVAHEMSHIRNLDVRVMTIVAALVGAVALLAGLGAARHDVGRRPPPGRRATSGGSGAAGMIFFAVWIVAILLAPLLAQLLAMMVSRRREYLADASGAELTRNPMGLARALEKIESAAAPTVSINRGTAHLCIADPLGRPMNLKEGAWANLFASHPPMAARIAALKEMAFQRRSMMGRIEKKTRTFGWRCAPSVGRPRLAVGAGSADSRLFRRRRAPPKRRASAS